MARLTARQQLFCDEYLIDLNATRAAVAAGYAEKYAHTNAAKLLQNTTIAAYILEKKKERSKRLEITQDAVLQELAIIAFAKATDYARVVEKDVMAVIDGEEVPVLDNNGNPVKHRFVEPTLTSELTEEQKKALAVIKEGRNGIEIKSHDKLRALEMLGRHLGLWDNNGDTDDNTEGDGFIEALRSEVAEVWEE